MLLRCECGGTLRREVLKEFDFTPVAGISSTLRNVRGLRCDHCHLPTLDGTVINATLRTMEIEVAKQSERLTSEHAGFLRQRMRLTQQSLADRMGIARETVADWERGASVISAQHDLMLRALAVVHLVETGVLPKGAMLEAIRSARVAPPRKTSAPILIDKVA